MGCRTHVRYHLIHFHRRQIHRDTYMPYNIKRRYPIFSLLASCSLFAASVSEVTKAILDGAYAFAAQITIYQYVCYSSTGFQSEPGSTRFYLFGKFEPDAVSNQPPPLGLTHYLGPIIKPLSAPFVRKPPIHHYPYQASINSPQVIKPFYQPLPVIKPPINPYPLSSPL